MSVQAQIERIQDEVSQQAVLIAQIQEAINNQESVPGGGGSPGSCTVTITEGSGRVFAFLFYTKVVDGQQVITVQDSLYTGKAIVAPIVLQDVLCGSTIALRYEFYMQGEVTTGGGVELEHSSMYCYVLKAPETDGAQGTVHFIDDD